MRNSFAKRKIYWDSGMRFSHSDFFRSQLYHTFDQALAKFILLDFAEVWSTFRDYEDIVGDMEVKRFNLIANISAP